MVFKVESKAAYYDCDETNKLKLSAAARYMQQTAGDHLDSIGEEYRYKSLYEEGLVFLLAKTCVKIEQMPEAAQEITIKTSPLPPKGPRFLREIAIEDKNGNTMISSLTLWLLVDPVSRKILRPSVFPYHLPYQESFLGNAVVDEKFVKVQNKEPDEIQETVIRYSHIDNNGHVNNSFYIDFVCNIIPYEDMCSKKISDFMISYINEAKIGDSVVVKRYNLGENSYYISASHGECPCFEAQVHMLAK